MSVFGTRRKSEIAIKNNRAGRDVNVVINEGHASSDPPLQPPFSDESEEQDGGTPLGGLRASNRLVRNLIGRAQELRTVDAWMKAGNLGREGRDDRVLIIHGAGGAGKTRLAAEILQAAKEEGWTTGFLSSRGAAHPNLARLTHPAQPTVIAVDYAEARHTDLMRVFEEASTAHDGKAPFRLILIVRESPGRAGSWLQRMEGPLEDLGARADRLLDERALTVISLEESLPDPEDRRAIWSAAYERYAGESPPAPDYLSEKLFGRPLFVLLDAHRAYAGGDGGGPPLHSEAELIQSVLKHERKYWMQALEVSGLKLSALRLNQVAAMATLVGGVDLRSFQKALAALEWLREDEELLRGVSNWWCSVYATGTGAIRGIEPDIVGEYLVMRALREQQDPRSELDGSLRAGQLRSLIEWATPMGRQRMLRVLTRIATGTPGAEGDGAKAVLAEVLGNHLDDFLPATFSEAVGAGAGGGTGEPLATTVASAVLASDQLQLMVAVPADPEAGDTASSDASSAVRATAVTIIQRQIEQVATVELESGRWTADRFGEVMAWVLKLQLETGEQTEAEKKLAWVARLEPRPHRALAVLRRELARWQLSKHHPEPARELLEAALADLAHADERESELSYVIANDLGDVAEHQGKTSQAIGRYEEALDGFRRLEGLGGRNSINTLLELIYSQGLQDLDKALACLDEAIEEMVRADIPAADVEEVRSARPRALLAAARIAGGNKEPEKAKELLERAREELDANGDNGSLVTCVVLDALGAIEAAQGNLEDGIALAEKALRGKIRLRGGITDPGTLSTLSGLVAMLAKSNVDRALQRLEELREELGASPGQLDALLDIQARLLVGQGRTEEAVALIRGNDESRLGQDTRREIFAAAADPSVGQALPLVVAIDACLLAARVFAAGDRRLVSLASRLALLIIKRGSAINGIRLSGSEADALIADERIASVMEQLDSADGTAEEMRLLAKPAANARSVPPSLVREGSNILRVFTTITEQVLLRLQELATDPFIADLATAGPDEATKLVDDPAVREWLARSTFWGPFSAPEMAGGSIGMLLSSILSLCLGEATVPPGAADSPQVWRRGPAPNLIAREEARLREDLQRIDGIDAERATALVVVAKANGMRQAGTTAEYEGELDEAERLYRAGLSALKEIGERDSVLAYQLIGHLATVEAKQDNTAAAIALGEEALSGMRSLLEGISDSNALNVIRNLMRWLAPQDLEEGEAVFDRAIEELTAVKAPPTEIAEVRRGWAEALRLAGHKALAQDNLDRAESLYGEALKTTETIGERESSLAWALVIDLGDVAAGRNLPERAIELYEEGLEGRRQLHGGINNENTVAVLLRLVSKLASHDEERAEAVLDVAIEEMSDAGQSDRLIFQVRRERAGLRLNRGREAVAAGDLDEAQSLLQSTLEELERHDDRSSPLALAVVYELAGLAAGRGEHVQAVALFEEAHTGTRRQRGLADVETVVTLISLAEVLATADSGRAMALLDGALRELEETGSENDLIARLRRGRVGLLQNAGFAIESERRFADAEAIYREALEELEALGESNSQLAYSLTRDLGDVARGKEERTQATEFYEEALAGLSKTVGSMHPETLSTLASLARVLAYVDVELALSRLDVAIKETEAGTPVETFLQEARADVLHSAARAAESEGEANRAEGLYRRVLEELEKIDALDSELAHVTVHDLGDIAASKGEVERAIELYEQALEGKRRIFGPGHPSTLDTHLLLARGLAIVNVDDGLASLERAIAEAEAEVDSDVARLRRGRADVLLEAGRAAEAAGELEQAETLFLRALREGGEDDGGNPILAHVLAHELGDIAAGRKDVQGAIERYEAAFEGKKEVRGGLSDMGTIATLLRLAEAVAQADLDGALALLDNAIGELQAEAAPAESILAVRLGRADVFREAGVSALIATQPDRAAELLQRALGVLDEIDEGDNLRAFVILHDLGHISSLRGEFEDAIALYKRALAGKRKLRDGAHPDTLVTLRALASAVARVNPLAAVSLLDDAIAELNRDGASAEAVASVKDTRAQALLEAGRAAERDDEFDEANELFAKAHAEFIAQGEKGRLLAAISAHDLGDVASAKNELERALELYEQAFAGKAEVLGGEHPNTLTSAAALAILTAGADLGAALDRIDSAIARLREVGAPEKQLSNMQRARANALHIAGQQAESEQRFEEAEALYKRALEGLREAGEGNSRAAFLVLHDLGDVAAAQEDFATAVAFFTEALEEGLRTGERDTRITMANLAAAMSQVDVEAAMAFIDSAIAQFEEAGDEEAVTQMRQDRAGAILVSGRALEGERELAEAEAHYLRALAELEEIGERDSLLAYVILHDLADVALAQGRSKQARELYEEALKGKATLIGAQKADTLTTLSRFAESIAATDLDRALTLLEEAALSLTENGDPEDSLPLMHRSRVRTLLSAGRAAMAQDEPERARERYEQALEEQKEIDGHDSALAYVILHDLADVALEQEELDIAIVLYEEALEGKSRWLGPSEWDTVTTLLSLASAVARQDRELALSLMEHAIEELAETEGSEGAIVRIRSWMEETGA